MPARLSPSSGRVSPRQKLCGRAPNVQLSTVYVCVLSCPTSPNTLHVPIAATTDVYSLLLHSCFNQQLNNSEQPTLPHPAPSGTNPHTPAPSTRTYCGCLGGRVPPPGSQTRTLTLVVAGWHVNTRLVVENGVLARTPVRAPSPPHPLNNTIHRAQCGREGMRAPASDIQTTNTHERARVTARDTTPTQITNTQKLKSSQYSTRVLNKKMGEGTHARAVALSLRSRAVHPLLVAKANRTPYVQKPASGSKHGSVRGWFSSSLSLWLAGT